MPLVTIIIPVYNVEKYLKKCLDSVVNQTYPNLEIIIINDASPDNSKEMITLYEKNFQNIKVINKIENEGLSEARNTGLKYAQGKYIFFLDSDDWIALDAIEKLVSIAKNYNSNLVQCDYTNILGNSKGRKEPEIITHEYRDLEKNKELLTQSSGVWNKLYHHSIIENFSFPKGLWYEDNAFIFPLLTEVKALVVTNEILYYYKRHLDSITLSTKIHPNEKIFDKYTIVKLIKEKCIELGTYETYKEQIDQITKNKILGPLLECTTWFQIPFIERSLLINNVYAYIKKEYNIETIEDITEGRRLDLIDRLRMPLLLKNLDYCKANFISTDEPLEEAKRIILKYKR